ncbi:alpha/beta fold hydrolase [Parvularcula sp. IMCC14364]|uniref:alpha/beta fold hydrolase n=1 Tax=Parvularcula sp. IMCC14364 TaxID=3067902 RepID=UPI00274223F8|nr:alpha/beta hydrolase [Parvularcula sp. IMCC14364]
MIKKLLIFLFVVVILIIFAGGFMIWFQTKGEPANQLEQTYMTPADRFVEVAGVRVRVREEGPVDAQPLVLIHGFTFSLETWDAWAEELKSDYRVIRYDLLGHGLTGPDPQSRYAPQERAVFLGQLLEALELEQPVIAGNSLGGLAAWRFAATAPESLAALILVSPGAYPQNGVTEEPAEVPDAMKAYLLLAPPEGVKMSADLIYADGNKITPERLTVLRDMMRREGNGPAMIESVEEFVLPDPEPLLSKITVPTLILWGEEDLLIPPADGVRMQKTIADARLITYPGVGHSAQEEAPAQTVADVRLFLEGALARPVTGDQ